MLCFNRVQVQLSTQQLQLGSLIKQVNSLVEQRDKQEKNILAGTRRTNKKRSAKTKKTRSGVEEEGKDGLGGGEAAEDGEEYLPPSQRDHRNEEELKAINKAYKNGRAEPESANMEKILKHGARSKNPAEQERLFQSFKTPFTDEIINTSKEVNGEDIGRIESRLGSNKQEKRKE